MRLPISPHPLILRLGCKIRCFEKTSPIYRKFVLMDTVAVQPKYSLSQDQEKKLIIREYRALLRSLKPKLKPGDKELIRLAFEMAADAHKTMRRKSGEPYILHPLAV